jgi:hypothetical protein
MSNFVALKIHIFIIKILKMSWCWELIGAMV